MLQNKVTIFLIKNLKCLKPFWTPCPDEPMMLMYMIECYLMSVHVYFCSLVQLSVMLQQILIASYLTWYSECNGIGMFGPYWNWCVSYCDLNLQFGAFILAVLMKQWY